jgi:uncharacterized membrane protein (UPF0182 family)
MESSSQTQISIPGFSAEQITALTKFMSDTIDAALDKYFGPQHPQQQPITVPKPSQRAVKNEEEESLQQAVSESKRSKQSTGSSSTSKKGTFSTLPHQATKQLCGDVPAHEVSSSNALLSLAYTRFGKELEATGQG